MPKDIDPDYTWLLTHLEFTGAIEARQVLAQELSENLRDRIESGRLPHTIGVFGGWGVGKTTFLAQLAQELSGTAQPLNIIYFNSWKYAGFLEIVPALIYKVIYYGIRGTVEQRKRQAMRALLGIGKAYSDKFGEWAEKKIGVNPVALAKDVVTLDEDKLTLRSNAALTHEYYTRVDKAQDDLEKVLGTVTAGTRPDNPIVVLIDELDRCDPDEAYTLIKQLRVLFSMRTVPIAFVVCANPEPIGLAIKHRYGLETDRSDYETRRILEKFVDAYHELGRATSYRSVVADIWRHSSNELPWLIRFDEANLRPAFMNDVVKNAAAFDVMSTDSYLFANLRMLRKSFEYVDTIADYNRELLWTKWLLEVANQLDPGFRALLRTLSQDLQHCIFTAYNELRNVTLISQAAGRRATIVIQASNEGATLFSTFRSSYWTAAEDRLHELQKSTRPQDVARRDGLKALLADPVKAEFALLTGLLPFHGAPDFHAVFKTESRHPPIPAERSEAKEIETLTSLTDALGFELAS